MASVRALSISSLHGATEWFDVLRHSVGFGTIVMAAMSAGKCPATVYAHSNGILSSRMQAELVGFARMELAGFPENRTTQTTASTQADPINTPMKDCSSAARREALNRPLRSVNDVGGLVF